MDPNLFHLDWDRTFEALAAIIALSFLVERVAALLFESKAFVLNTKIPEEGSKQASREQAAASLANDIMRATAGLPAAGQADDAASEAEAAVAQEVAELTKELSTSSLLWPIDQTNPARARERAGQVLDDLERRQDRRRRLGSFPIKELGAFILAAVVVVPLHFDAFSIILLAEETSRLGTLGTAAVIAGGSKASIKLFQDVLGARSNTVDQVRKPKDGRR